MNLGRGETKQQQYTHIKNRIEYFLLRQNTSTTAIAIAIRSHVTEAAYQNTHGKNPYLDDVVECLDNDTSRLAKYLAKNHGETFIDAANESKVVALCVLNAEESASDQQCNTIMGHLRLKFKAKIAVSLLDTKRRCYEGYTAPRVKLSTVEKEIRK